MQNPNLIPQIAQLLNVKIGQQFKILKPFNETSFFNYVFSHNDLIFIDEIGYPHIAEPIKLHSLITGFWKIHYLQPSEYVNVNCDITYNQKYSITNLENNKDCEIDKCHQCPFYKKYKE